LVLASQGDKLVDPLGTRRLYDEWLLPGHPDPNLVHFQTIWGSHHPYGGPFEGELVWTLLNWLKYYGGHEGLGLPAKSALIH
jgi:hypothetical protein